MIDDYQRGKIEGKRWASDKSYEECRDRIEAIKHDLASTPAFDPSDNYLLGQMHGIRESMKEQGF